METESLKEYKRSEICSIVLAVISSLYSLNILYVLYDSLINEYYKNNAVYFDFNRICFLITILLAMTLFEIYILVYYGKKENKLFLFSIGSFTLAQIIYLFDSDNNDYKGLQIILIALFVFLFFDTINSFKLLKTSKMFSVFSFTIVLLSGLSSIYSSYITTQEAHASLMLFRILPYIAYMIFFVFCSKNHKTNDLNNIKIQQEKTISDLNIQLTNLKNDFESGKISKDEYDNQRKNLVDKLLLLM